MNFDNALRKAVCEYTEEKLNSGKYKNDIFVTSLRFNKSIEKMIKSEHYFYHKITLTKTRKILCAAVVIIALLAASLTVESVRDFFVNVFDNNDNSFVSNVANNTTSNKQKPENKNNEHKHKHKQKQSKISRTKDNETKKQIKSDTNTNIYPTKLEIIYEIGFIPEGYELAEEEIAENHALFSYVNNSDSLIFEQQTKDIFSGNVDNRLYSKAKEIYSGQTFIIYKSKTDNTTLMVWDNGEYVFNMSSRLSKKIMFELYDSLKIRKEKDNDKIIRKETETEETTKATEAKAESESVSNGFKKIYELTSVPNGYQLVEKAFSGNCLSYTYRNDNNDLVYQQYLKEEFPDEIIDDYSSYVKEYHNAQAFYIYSNDNNEYISVVWNKEDYKFLFSGCVSKSVFYQLFDLIKIKTI
ncbi:MAG: DUF4367 domain-containing protein [Ruminococcus sp.]|nr:DUF4367 domain-containing protein [Ruminococcus sp.]